MEESPPPVPPKDYSDRQRRMSGSRPPSAGAPASGSKRKRAAQDDTVYERRNGRLEVADTDVQGTPKRQRSTRGGISDSDISTDNTPIAQRGLRRKKGSRNLSNLNLRHAASLQALPQGQVSPSRESKFQEGSLSDKPSDKPPSMFTRFTRTDSGNLTMVDELMSDYHESAERTPTPAEFVEKTLQYEKDTRDERVAEITARQEKENAGPIFRFGKSSMADFNPVKLWNRMWGEKKDELIRHNIAEAERKAREKAEVEARYARMKADGQIPMHRVQFGQPHDSAIVLEDNKVEVPHQYLEASIDPALRRSHDDVNARDGSEVPESVSKPLRAIKSRLHLRKPSMQSLKDGLKRAKSDFNLSATAASREPSSSVSPIKTEFSSALKRSVSKYDLKQHYDQHKQHKLTKRVSDLELKLQKARSELDQALAEASPAPKLNGKYQRFTPNNTIRKQHKFVPGALPTLPSGQVLFPEELGFRGDEENIARFASDPRPRRAFDLSEAFDDLDDGENTPRLARGRGRATSREAAAHEVRKNQENNQVNQIQDLLESDEADDNRKHNDNLINNNAVPLSNVAEKTDTDPNRAVNVVSNHTAGGPKPMYKKKLDAELKALDGNVKLTKKTPRPKRKSTDKDDKLFRPDAVSGDDDEWEEAARTPKKKRKSAGKTENPTRITRGAAKTKSPKNATRDALSKTSPKNMKSSIPVATTPPKIVKDIAMGGVDASEDELAKSASARGSVAPEGDQILEPVFEEEEETSTIASRDEPPEPAARAAPLRYGRHAVRSRSSSPQKRSEPLTAEERMISRAAVAAHRKRPSRSASPPPTNYSKKIEVSEEVVIAIPGQGEVPKLPTGANGSFDSLTDAAEAEILRTKKSFEGWPEDCF